MLDERIVGMPALRQAPTPERITDPAVYNLGQLTQGEKLFLWRWRLKDETRRNAWFGAGARKESAAAELGITPGTYDRLERGLPVALDLDQMARVTRVIEDVATPNQRELCALARRRSCMPAREVARQFGGSAVLFNNLEREGSPRIVKFWEEMGFRFP
jgi:hypothetical protein